MEKVGSMRFEIITTGKVLHLKVHAKPYSYETLATKEELMALSRYLEDQARKLYDEREEEER